MGPVALLAQQPTPVAPGVRPVEVHAETAHWQQRFLDYTSDIQKHGVSKLDGYNINLGAFQSTLPKCVSANIFLARVLPLLSGLKLPWHRRKLTAGARADILLSLIHI